MSSGFFCAYQRGTPMADAPANPTAPAPPAVPPERKVDDFTTRMIAQHGTIESALRATAMRLFTAEDSAASLTSQVDQYKAKLPEGSVVLPPDRAKAFNAFEVLKLTPEQVAEAVKKRDELQATVNTHGIEKLSREGAPVIGFDPDATAGLVSSKGLHLELREVEVEVDKAGKKEKVKQKVPFVRPAADEKAQLQPLTEYAKTLPAFEQRALQAVPADKATPTPGTPYPESRPTPSGADSTPAATIMQSIRQRYPLPSELRKQQQPATQGA